MKEREKKREIFFFRFLIFSYEILREKKKIKMLNFFY
jgi:hypothetical protein